MRAEHGTAPSVRVAGCGRSCDEPRQRSAKSLFHRADRQLFLATLARVVSRYGWLCHGYCVMVNHYHPLIETPRGNLSLGMRQLNGMYTQSFNRRHRRVGHLFQGRFKAILVEKESYLLGLYRYIVLHPLRVNNRIRIGAWQWSSYRATAGLASVPEYLSTDWVLEQFGKNRSLRFFWCCRCAT